MHRKLILLIDHEVSVREVLRVCLSSLGGWNVLSVASLQEGLHLLKTNTPDAILLDSPKVETDGFTFMQELRERLVTPSIPVLLITGKARWFSRQQLQELGVSGAIAKPFNPITLPTQISALLNWS